MHSPAPAPAEAPAFSRTYPGRADQIRIVRADLRLLLDECAIADDAILCASELAANAALHSNSRLPGGQFTVRATFCLCGRLRIEVEDEGGRWTNAARPPSLGRGLDIVHTLAAAWGINGDYRGRTFWVRLGEMANKAVPSLRGTRLCQAPCPDDDWHEPSALADPPA